LTGVNNPPGGGSAQNAFSSAIPTQSIQSMHSNSPRSHNENTAAITVLTVGPKPSLKGLKNSKAEKNSLEFSPAQERLCPSKHHLCKPEAAWMYITMKEIQPSYLTYFLQ